MAWVSGNLVHTTHQYLDAAGDPKTGMVKTTDIEFTLYRDPGSGAVAATETVAYTETGSSGYYTISFTPDNTGLYTLWGKEINADSYMRNLRSDWSVVSAGSVFTPAFSNAFCGKADMERWLQQSITGSTAPSSTEAAAFAETRAAVLMGMAARLGFTVTPTSVSAGSRLEDILREANAIGSAMDYTVAQSFKEGTRRTERIPELLGLWRQYTGDETKDPRLYGFLGDEVRGNLASLSTDHIVSGDTQAAPSSGTPTDSGIQINMSDLF